MQLTTAPTAEDKAFKRLISYAAMQWPGYRDAAHHRLIARHLEAVERGEITRLMITMPPRHGKSMLASEFFPAWYMGRNPSHYVISATYAQELADDFGRKVRNQISDPLFASIFPGVRIKADSTSVKRFHVSGPPDDSFALTQDGAYFAVGVGGPLTGRGAHLLLIDDPVKNREEAESETMRRKTADWYTSTAYTRLMPGGRVIIIQCMTGDTPVLMATGREKPLRDIRPGDRVATYDNGKIAVSTVRNWTNNGPDRVFAIRMSSGRIVKANARHPFLVDLDGEPTWTQTKNLRPGHAIFRVSGASGKARLASTKVATSQSAAEDIARLTTTRSGGLTAFARLRSILDQGVKRICAIATGLASLSMKDFLPSRVAFVPCASSRLPARTRVPIGMGSSASIIATIARRFAGFSATIATLQSDMERPLKSSVQPLSTCEITRDTVVEVVDAGVEDVFDVQIDRTENFIAGGLVSHNTRWHEDDLSGWLQREHGHEGWTVLDLPAISDDGKALWPEQYDLEALERIKRAIGTRDWSALYQQRPTPEEGDYFKRDWLKYHDETPDPKTLRIYGASDYAVTADDGDFTVHMVFGVDALDNIWLLDVWRKQTASDQWVESWCDLVLRWKPAQWGEETGQINSGVGPFLVKRAKERRAFTWRRGFASRHDKAIRARAIQGRMSMQGLNVSRHAPWLADFENELTSFPNGKNDDQVDALSLFGQLLDLVTGKRHDAEKPEKKKELIYTAKPDGTVIGNMSVKEAVEAMVRRRRGGE